MGRLGAGQTVVCSSTGNFGQAMAYAGRRRGIAVEVFVPTTVNPVKLARMRSFGARVTAAGADSAAAEAARATMAATRPRGTSRTVESHDGGVGSARLLAPALDTIVVRRRRRAHRRTRWIASRRKLARRRS